MRDLDRSLIFGLLDQALDGHGVDGRLAMAVALEEDPLAVGRKDRGGSGGRGLVLAEGQFPADRAQQQQNMRLGFGARHSTKTEASPLGENCAYCEVGATSLSSPVSGLISRRFEVFGEPSGEWR